MPSRDLAEANLEHTLVSVSQFGQGATLALLLVPCPQARDQSNFLLPDLPPGGRRAFGTRQFLVKKDEALVAVALVDGERQLALSLDCGLVAVVLRRACPHLVDLLLEELLVNLKRTEQTVHRADVKRAYDA